MDEIIFKQNKYIGVWAGTLLDGVSIEDIRKSNLRAYEVCQQCVRRNEKATKGVCASCLCGGLANFEYDEKFVIDIKNGSSMLLEIQSLKNELQIEKDRANALELVASKPCKNCKRSELVREAVLFGRSYGVAQIEGRLFPNLKEINDWLISEGIEPFGEIAKQRHSITKEQPNENS